jgi:aminomethyltransferase
VLLLQELLGDWVGQLGYFKFRQANLDGIPFLLARSGWSPERGYELYLQDESRGEELWHRLMKAGRKYNIMPGVPNQIRRIEGGMLSYGSDIKNHNALELGLPKRMVSKSSDFIGKAALERIAAEGGPQRRVVGVMLTCEDPLEVSMMRDWKLVGEGGEDIGFVSSFTYSPVLGNIGIATVTKMCSKAGTKVQVETPVGRHDAIVHKLPFMPRVA